MPSRFWRASGNALLPGSNVLGPATGGLGPEIVTDGAFNSAANWIIGAGWAVTGGQAVASGTTNFLWQSNAGIVAGHTYRVTFTLSGYTAGGIVAYLGSAVTSGTERSANNTYTQDITPTGGGELGFGTSNSFAGTIDDFSVKEVL